MDIEELNNYIRDGGDPDYISFKIDPTFRSGKPTYYVSLLTKGKDPYWLRELEGRMIWQKKLTGKDTQSRKKK